MSDNESAASSDSHTSSIKPSAGKAFAHATSFDAYFAAVVTPARTGNDVFSSLAPLEPEDYAKFVTRAIVPTPLDATPFFGVYAQSIDAGFSIMFYGYGSKLATLNAFARTVLAGRGPVLVSRCFAPRFDLKLFLGTLQRATSAAAPTVESALSALDSAPHPVFLLLHSLDKGPPKVRAAVMRLAAHKHTRVVASLDHIRASALFTQRELADWVWHDLTTLAPYDAELAHIDPLELRQSKDGSGGAAGAHARITESGATHVLASVTDRAKKLFAMMARRQLDSEDAEEGGNAEPDAGVGMEWDPLLDSARREFLAQNDAQLRSILGEFTDHGLVRVDGDSHWVPLRKDVLQRVLEKSGLRG